MGAKGAQAYGQLVDVGTGRNPIKSGLDANPIFGVVDSATLDELVALGLYGYVAAGSYADGFNRSYGIRDRNENDTQKRVYSPANPGPLKQEIAETFSGGVYTEYILEEDTVMYRVYGGEAGKYGRFVSKTKQNGGLQSQLDLALNPDWGNTTDKVTEVIVPKGTVVYEGIAGTQNIYDSSGNVIGTLPGGGNQVFIPEINEEWFQ